MLLSSRRVERSTLGLTVFGHVLVTKCCVVASARNRAASFFGRRGDRSFGPEVRHIDHYRLEGAPQWSEFWLPYPTVILNAVVLLDSQTFSIIKKLSFFLSC